MITLTNILKKSFSLCAIVIATCLIFGTPESKAGECTTNSSANTGIKSASTYAAKGGCLSPMPLQMSNKTNISSIVGPRGGKMHNGMDVGTTGGCQGNLPGYSTIYMPADGEVHMLVWNCSTYRSGGEKSQSAGNYVVFKHQMNPNSIYKESKACTHYYTVFMHLSSSFVSPGGKYKKGVPVARVGGTACYAGRLLLDKCICKEGSCGHNPHMHYELRTCDPFRGKPLNPLCPSNQNLCDGVTPVGSFDNPDFSGGPGSNNGVYVPPVDEVDCCTVASKACQQEVKNANQCSACKDKNKAHQECEKRNEAIRTGGVYCAPTEEGGGSSSTAPSSGGNKACMITKTATGAKVDPAITDAIGRASQATGIPAAVIAGIIQQESTFNPKAKSSAGAMGCMQLMPGTWRDNNCSGSPWNPYDNIMCGTKYYKKLLQNKTLVAYTQGDPLRALAGYNWGPAHQCLKRANWRSCLPSETSKYVTNVPNYQKQIAQRNGCSLDGIGTGTGFGGGNCEDFGAMAGMNGDVHGMMDFQSNYKCNYSENYSSLKGCIFCDLFRIIFNTASEVARKCHETLSSSLITLLAIGLAIWLAMLIMKYVSDWTVKDPGMLLNDIFRKTFIVCVIILLLKLNVTEFFNLFVTPVFRTGYNLGILVMDSTPGVTLPQETWDINGSGLPSEMGLSMLQGIYAVQSRLEQLMALGSHTICIAFYVKSFHGYPIFPHFGYLLTGVFLWLIAIVFMVVYPFLLLDSVLQFTIASSLFPAALAATAFKITKDKLNIFKIINIFINAMFVFIFLTIILFILLAGMDEAVLSKIKGAVETADAGSYFDLKEYGWFTVAFAKLVFFLFLGKAVLEDIPSFAERFGSAISFGEKYSPLPSGKGSIGRSLGGLFAGAATGMATQGAMPLAKGAVKGAFRATKNISGGFGSSLKSGVRSFRIARTQNQAASLATGSGIGAAAGTPTANGQAWVESRNWLRFGQKEMRRVSYDADGQAVLETQRRSLFKKTKTLTKSSEDFEMILKQARNGEMQESYKFRKGDIGSLINADGTRNEEACNRLMRTSGLSADELNKVRLNQTLKERMPNAKGANLEGKFVSEQIVNSKDAQGRDVFEVRRVDKDGKVHVFKMTKGQKRDLIEYETIGKDGKATKLSSDGILQKKESYQYELDAAGRPVLNEDGSYKIKDNSRRVQFSHAKAFKGVKFFDDDGFLERGARDLEFMMSPEDLALYKRQMKRYGDTLQHRAFDK